jgi:uncharacterized protein YqgC (DUF456 family)
MFKPGSANNGKRTIRMSFLSHYIVWITLVLMLVGMVTILVPVLPGLMIMWLAAIAYGFVHGFNTLGIVLIGVITLLAFGGMLVDNILIGAGARKSGASWGAIVVALLGGLLGTVFFPPFGGFIAAPVAIFLLEYLRLKDVKKAWQALVGLATGFGASYVTRILLGMVIIGLWAIWVWKG